MHEHFTPATSKNATPPFSFGCPISECNSSLLPSHQEPNQTQPCVHSQLKTSSFDQENLRMKRWAQWMAPEPEYSSRWRKEEMKTNFGFKFNFLPYITRSKEPVHRTREDQKDSSESNLLYTNLRFWVTIRTYATIISKTATQLSEEQSSLNHDLTSSSGHQSWSNGSVITRPKKETSSSIIHVGIACFLFFSMSFWAEPTPSFASAVLSAELPPVPALSSEFSLRCSDMTCSGTSSESCCWLYFSTYSGNIFLNVELLEEN